MKPVSASLQLPAGGKVRKVVEETLKAIDSVHGDGVLPAIPVEPSRGNAYLGALHHTMTPSGKQATKISVKAGGPWPMLTAAHETGHFLDLEGVGAKGRFATDTGEAGTNAVIAALKASAAAKSLEAQRDASTSTRERAYFNYMLDPKELWARAYSQFIAQESGNPTLQAELGKAHAAAPGRQWAKDDFAPAAAAFRALFKQLNWI
jgi:hypothetical protein